MNRRTLLCAATLALLPVATLQAQAQSQDAAWPAKPVKIIVPFPPGGTSDVMARMVSEELAKALKQPVIIENIGGTAAPPARRVR